MPPVEGLLNQVLAGDQAFCPMAVTSVCFGLKIPTVSACGIGAAKLGCKRIYFEETPVRFGIQVRRPEACTGA